MISLMKKSNDSTLIWSRIYNCVTNIPQIVTKMTSVTNMPSVTNIPVTNIPQSGLCESDRFGSKAVDVSQKRPMFDANRPMFEAADEP